MSKSSFDNFEIPKLNVKEVLNESINIYKTGFSQLFPLSLIMFIINFISSVVNFFVYHKAINPYLRLTLVISSMIMFIIVLYILGRISIAIYRTVHKLFISSNISLKDEYKKSKNGFWRYIGVSVLFGIIICTPLIGIAVLYKFINSLVIKYAAIIILLIPTVFLFVRYSFAPISAILKNQKHKYFENSKLLVNGDFWRIVILILVSSIIFIIPYQIYIRVLFDYSKMTQLHKFIAGSLNQLFLTFTTPFSYIVTVDMYLTLKRNKRIG